MFSTGVINFVLRVTLGRKHHIGTTQWKYHLTRTTIHAMELIIGFGVLVLSGALLYVAGDFLVSGLLKLSRYFKITKFAVAFFVMAFAASLPNLFVGITAALQGMPELSFGDVMGNNIIALTVAVALGIFFSQKHELPLEGDTIRDTTFLTTLAAILPLILISDGVISRSDGFVLLLFFLSYMYWLYIKKERFSVVYEEDKETMPRSNALKYVVKVVAGIVLLSLGAQGVVYSATLIGLSIGMPLMLVGILIIGLGGALPEVYFTVVSARRGETGMIIGSLMGAVIIPATLVLGTVALIHPIYNENLEFPLIGRIFLVGIAFFFLFVSQTKSTISKQEGYILLLFYVLFVASFFVL